MRHANPRVTMDTYVQAVSDEKRKAQSKVVIMLCLVFAKGKRSSLINPYWTPISAWERKEN